MDHATKDVMDAAQRALQAWQETHPDASFAEIESAVEQHLSGVRAQLVGKLVDRGMTDEHPVCRGCGTIMVPRSQSSRKVVIQGNVPVRLDRAYIVCPDGDARSWTTADGQVVVSYLASLTNQHGEWSLVMNPRERVAGTQATSIPIGGPWVFHFQMP